VISPLKILKSAIDEAMHGGHLAALVLPSIVLTIGLIRDDPLNLPVLAISYLVPLIIYSYNYYGELDADRLTNPDRTTYLEKKVRVYPFLISGYVALLSTLIVLCGSQLLKLGAIVGVLLAAGVLYTLCLKRLTRHVPGFKTYFVTAEWALAVVLMYTLYVDGAPVAFLLAIFGFVFLRVLVNTIFSDLRDIGSDSMDGLKTIPVVLGWSNTIQLLHIFNLASLVPLTIGMLTGELPRIALVLIVFTMYDFYYLRHAELAGEQGMTPKDYAIADYEFLLWPWAVGTGVMLLDRFGPLLPATLSLLIVALTARELLLADGPCWQKSVQEESEISAQL
jgi:4-hydroxybenzoate polyprenyltransferase